MLPISSSSGLDRAFALHDALNSKKVIFTNTGVVEKIIPIPPPVVNTNITANLKTTERTN